MVGESCFEGVLYKTDVSLRWFVVICFDRCLVDYGRLEAITIQRTVNWLLEDHAWNVGLTFCVR